MPSVCQPARPPETIGFRHVEFDQGGCWALGGIELHIMPRHELRNVPQVNHDVEMPQVRQRRRTYG